jgi:hypothetical protein
MTVQLKGPMEAVHSLAETSSRDIHQAEAKTSVQPPWKLPAMMPGDRWSWKHTAGAVTTEEPWCSTGAVLRRQQLGNSSSRPNPQKRKVVRCRDQKQKRHDQYNAEEPFMKSITDITGHDPSENRKWRYACWLLGPRSLKKHSI